MLGRREFALMGTAATAATLLQKTGKAQDQPKPGQTKHADHLSAAHAACAEACGACQRECDSCSSHCAHQLAAGKKEHALSLASCLDCADFCSAAASIVARGGPYAAVVCAACADVCASCAKECMKFSDDTHMKACAEECRKCEQACRDMLKHASK